MAKDCQDMIPRECAESFQRGAERMGVLENKTDNISTKLDTVAKDVSDMKALLQQAKGAAFAGKAFAGLIGGSAVVIWNWLTKGQ